jgi:hypothetical protein
MITYEEVKQKIPMEKILHRYGFKLDRSFRMACPIHSGDNPQSFVVHDQGRKWTCHTKGCGKAGSVIDFVAAMEKVETQEAFIKLKEWFHLEGEKHEVKAVQPFVQVGEPILYEYRNADGTLAYTVKRIDKSNGEKTRKEFIPELPDGTHALPSEKRVLYNLPAITACGEDFVCLCEGEKTANALIECGFVGTTFSNGCSGWLDQYAESLKGKDVVLMPDADEGGEKWLKTVTEGLQGIVGFLRTVSIPDKFILEHPEYKGHDFADFLKESGSETAILWLTEAITTTEPLPRGVDRKTLNVMTDVCREAIEVAKTMTDADGMDLSKMFGPPMKVRVRPADLMMIIAPTGVGKSRIIANFTFEYPNLNFALFDLELSRYQLGLRAVAYHNSISFVAAEDMLRAGRQLKCPTVENVFLPKIAGLTVEKLRDEVSRIEDFQERRVDVVAIDYVSKMKRNGNLTDSIIENTSDFKKYLVEENRIGIITTQSKRISEKVMKYNMPTKEDAIYTSAIEQNCQQALCFCFAQNNQNIMLCSCDKYSHGTEPEDWVELDLSNMRMRYRGIHQRVSGSW